jgi:hypothetical protein
MPNSASFSRVRLDEAPVSVGEGRKPAAVELVVVDLAVRVAQVDRPGTGKGE